MKKLFFKKVVGYYCLGVLAALLIIGVIHGYSYFFEPYFCYAELQNLLKTSLLCGIPFGLSIGCFHAARSIP
ncbi:hypothetical protein [Flavobacterium sp.]|uniref:hypothetical protein n=1 Tax=Flavobacterium sp. TaxID=239 RepID=UPI0026274585|nr:hypothetical protein [Flavobacterium sp.]